MSVELKMPGHLVEAIKIASHREWHEWFEEKVREASMQIESCNIDEVAKLQGKIQGIRVIQNTFKNNFGL